MFHFPAIYALFLLSWGLFIGLGNASGVFGDAGAEKALKCAEQEETLSGMGRRTLV